MSPNIGMTMMYIPFYSGDSPWVGSVHKNPFGLSSCELFFYKNKTLLGLFWSSEKTRMPSSTLIPFFGGG